MNLPHHRRHQWPIGRWRYNKWRITALVLFGLLALAVWIRHEHLVEHNLRLTREAEVRDLVINHYALTGMGAPGMTKTDIKEDTGQIDAEMRPIR